MEIVDGIMMSSMRTPGHAREEKGKERSDRNNNNNNKKSDQEVYGDLYCSSLRKLLSPS